MKRKLSQIVLVLLMVLLLAACMRQKKYVLYQAQAEIETIEIVEVALNDPYTPLADITIKRTIRATEIPQFINDLLAIDCYEYWNDPLNIINGISIKIVYKNGEIEMISPASCGLFVNKNGNYQNVDFNRFYFDTTGFYALLDKYLWN